MPSISEKAVEDLAADQFAAAGFRVADGRDLSPEAAPAERADFGQAVLAGQFALAVRRLNPWLPPSEIDQIVRTVLHPPHASLAENNRWLHTLLTDGVEVEYK